MKLNTTNGLTFVEILVATAIIALVAGMLLTVFGFSFKHNREAEATLEATFIAQRKMEMLQGMDALSAYNEGRKGIRQKFMEKYVEVTCRPYLPDDCHVFDVVVKNEEGRDGILYAAPPDNADVFLIEGWTDDIFLEISIFGNRYEIISPDSPDKKAVTGWLPGDTEKVVVMINGVEYSLDKGILIDISSAGRDVEARVYDTNNNSSLINVEGTGVIVKRYTNYSYRDYSTVRAQVKVFDTQDDARPKAVFESILQLKN